MSYLKTSGLFDRLVEDAPFHYTSPNAPEVRDVVGTAVLAIICGFTRYVHINRLRNDVVLPMLLGLRKIVSEDSVRRALKAANEQDLKPCKAIARLIAIVANWWNIFCRLADGDRHLEPTTSRPMYMGIVGHLVVSGRKRLLRLTSTHLKATELQFSLMRIGEFMKRISAIAEQLDFNRVWELIILAAFRKWLGTNRTKGLLAEPLALIA